MGGMVLKVILSRKGFDSKAGGHPNAHFVDNGRLLVLPIPEDNKSNNINTGRTYTDLRFNDQLSYLDIMNQLGLNGFDNKYVHLDPDVNHHIVNRHPNWKGLFGQSHQSQVHLQNKGIEKGDLFLFFGWFCDVVNTDKGYKYVRGTDRHIIWGYLQVDEIERIDQSRYYQKWKFDHPHYFYGVFSFNEKLVLTAPNNKRSIWKLPQFFHPQLGTLMSYHKDKTKWEMHNDHCILQSAGRGQEFVIEGNEQVEQWAKDIIGYSK
jgi:hypothetical protein